MNKILILGLGSAQEDIIKYCRKQGFYVYAVSNVLGYPAERFAEESYQIDIVDAEQLVRFSREKEIDLVYSVGSDMAMPTIAKVSKELDLPCFMEEWTAIICNHKQLLRKTLGNNIEGNIPYQIIESPEEEIGIKFPLMMKPSDSQGQRGVHKIDHMSDIKKYFQEVVRFSREKKVILEQFIEGDEISVNVFLENGLIKFYLISDRIIWEDYPGGIIHEHVIPSKYEEQPKIVEKIKRLVAHTLKAIQLKNGPAYFQIKINSLGKPYLIEVTPRLDGCHMWRLIQYATGINLLEASIELLQGKSYNQNEEFHIRPCSLEFLCEKPGSVFYKSHYRIPENVYLQWYYEDGQTVRTMNGYYEKCGYIIKRGK